MIEKYLSWIFWKIHEKAMSSKLRSGKFPRTGVYLNYKLQHQYQLTKMVGIQRRDGDWGKELQVEWKPKGALNSIFSAQDSCLSPALKLIFYTVHLLVQKQETISRKRKNKRLNFVPRKFDNLWTYKCFCQEQGREEVWEWLGWDHVGRTGCVRLPG